MLISAGDTDVRFHGGIWVLRGPVRGRAHLFLAFLGGVVAFVIFDPIARIPSGVLVILDAGGLSLFAVSGASKSLLYGLTPVSAMRLGAVTATGGGVIRDVLLNKLPAILRIDVYASAPPVGVAVMTVGVCRGRPRGQMMLIGGASCRVLRLIAVRQHWGLPYAGAL